MKILYIHQYFAVPNCGGATRSYEMARRLVRAGHEVTLLTSSAFLPKHWALRPGWSRHDVEGINVEVLRLPYSNKCKGTPIFAQLGDTQFRAPGAQLCGLEFTSFAFG